eukprot:762871_1
MKVLDNFKVHCDILNGIHHDFTVNFDLIRIVSPTEIKEMMNPDGSEISIILIARVRRHPEDINLRGMIDNGTLLCESIMAFKLSNAYEQTIAELQTLIDIERRHGRFGVPNLYKQCILVYKSPKAKAIMFGMQCCTMDLGCYAALLDKNVQISALERVTLKLDKIFKAAIINQKITEHTQMVHTDVKAANIFLNVVKDSFRVLDSGVQINKMQTLMGDWGLVAHSNPLMDHKAYDEYLGDKQISPTDIVGKTGWNIHKVLAYELSMTIVQTIDTKIVDQVMEVCMGTMSKSDKRCALEGLFQLKYDRDKIQPSKYLQVLDSIIGLVLNNVTTANKRKTIEQFILDPIFYEILSIGAEYITAIDYCMTAIDYCIKDKVMMWEHVKQIEIKAKENDKKMEEAVSATMTDALAMA